KKTPVGFYHRSPPSRPPSAIAAPLTRRRWPTSPTHRRIPIMNPACPPAAGPRRAAHALDPPAHRRFSPTQEPACVPPLEPSVLLAPPLTTPAQRWMAGAPSAPSGEDANAGASAWWLISCQAAADSSPYLSRYLLRKGSIPANLMENPSWFMT
ncbi:unnamed protein product, partial [Urochloa humidicola]